MVLDFSERLTGLGLKANNETLEKFDIYYRYLISENEVMNLTSITKREDVYNKHFLDSLMLTRAFDPNDKTLLDIGSGAGFPSLPLKLFFPSLKVTVIEATGKKIGFLERLVGKLGFDDVTLLNIRAEDYEMKEAFQIVTARAVAKLNILAELALPFVKKNGLFIAMKNQDHLEELSEAKKAIRILGGGKTETIDYEIADKFSRSLIVIQKERKTPPIYPRPYSKIKNKPL